MFEKNMWAENGMLRARLQRSKWIALVMAIMLASGTLALAQGYGGPAQVRQYGFQQGYQDGTRQGQDDSRDRRSYNLQGADWDRASRGYDNRMGPFGQYRDAYRDGYRQGYEAAFYRDGGNPRFDRSDYRYGRGFDRRPGYGFGFQDGAAVAREDMYKGKPYNPYPRGKYGDQDRGYRREFGDKHAYRFDYGQGYRAGYESSFRWR
ncbi:MAG: hypothetical protein JST79_14435 [Acidobacteria bacterium]|jgi:hypothetical protein|nr:hypothetical protein [Acidobacteriota bacterium]